MTSALEILLGPIGQGTTRFSKADKREDTETARTLEAFSREIVGDMLRDNAAYAYLLADHVSEFPGDLRLTSAASFIQYRAKLVDMVPGVQLDILTSAAEVKNLERRAVVWLTCTLSYPNVSNMARRESVAVLYWQRKRRATEWRCASSKFVHGYWE